MTEFLFWMNYPFKGPFTQNESWRLKMRDAALKNAVKKKKKCGAEHEM